MGRLTYARAAIALMIAGAGARIAALVVNWNAQLGADSQEYLLLARRYSFAEPFSASYREPLWRAIVKVATGPFDYSPHALRTFTTLVSIAALPVAWLVLRRVVARWGLHPRMALIAFAVFALSQQVIREAPRGLREGTCVLLFLGVALPLLNADRSRRAALGIGSCLAAMSLIRWELATLLVAVTLVFALARRVSPLAPALALVCVVAFSGPWLLAHKREHGSLSYQSKVHSTFYWKLEQPPTVRAKYAVESGEAPKVALTWQQYYLDFLGPQESARRLVMGYPRLTAKLVASQVVPRGAAMSAIGEDQRSRSWLVVIASLSISALAALALVLAPILRDRALRTLFATSLALTALFIAPYAALASFVELRVLMFTVPLLGLVAACFVEGLVALSRSEQRVRLPFARSAPAPTA